MELTNEQFKACIEAMTSADHWGNIPRVCAALAAQLISSNAARSEAFFKVETAEWMGNPVHGLHGGAITTIFDNAMGSLLFSVSDGNFSPTASISVDFLRPLKAGDTVYVKVRITKLGRSIAYLTGELFKDPDGDKPHATSTCIYSTAYRIQL